MVDHLFRHESGKMISVICRLVGFENLQLAEDIVNDTLVKAMQDWPYKGIPANPPAWLYSVAKNKAIDVLRRRKNYLNIQNQIGLDSDNIHEQLDEFFLESEIHDAQLRMIFACCHPRIKKDYQIVLILKSICGFSAKEISLALLTSEENVNKRLYRVKKLIKEQNLELEVPHGDELKSRLETVIQSIYLLFNEGYYSYTKDNLLNRDLCYEALRLALLLSDHKMIDSRDCNALIALICFHSSRFDARLDEEGKLIRFEKQDRNKWNRELIEKGFHFLTKAGTWGYISKLMIEASIANLYVSTESFEDTPWSSITSLYDSLLEIEDTEVVRLNRSYVLMKDNKSGEALEELMKLTKLNKNHLYHATIAKVYNSLGDTSNSKKHYEEAIKLCKHEEEKLLLKEDLNAL